MAEIEITLPTVQYGNVKVRATPEEFGFELDEPGAFGYALAIYQTTFTLGFKDGSQVDVMAPVAASYSEPTEEAVNLLASGLGGVSKVEEHEDVDTIQGSHASGLEPEAPWNRKVDAKPKPWETSATGKAPVVTADW